MDAEAQVVELRKLVKLLERKRELLLELKTLREQRERDRACEDRHVRVGERQEDLRSEIDKLRTDLADLTGTALRRSEWARDRETFLAQGETMTAYLKDILKRTESKS
jgi:hypothetical protein